MLWQIQRFNICQAEGNFVVSEVMYYFALVSNRCDPPHILRNDFTDYLVQIPSLTVVADEDAKPFRIWKSIEPVRGSVVFDEGYPAAVKEVFWLHGFKFHLVNWLGFEARSQHRELSNDIELLSIVVEFSNHE